MQAITRELRAIRQRLNNNKVTSIIGSFYMNTFFKLPRQKGLLFMQPNWASALVLFL